MKRVSSIALIPDPFLAERRAFFEYHHCSVITISGFQPQVPFAKELPRAYSTRVAYAQAAYLAAQLTDPDYCCIGFSTVVSCGRRLLSVPATDSEARAMLMLLSGRRHRLLTTFVLGYRGKTYQRQIETRVQWKRLTTVEVDHYIAARYYQQRVGGYLPVEWPQKPFIKAIGGDPFNLQGVPAYALRNLLIGLGIGGEGPLPRDIRYPGHDV
jgi:septum formation protein